MKDKILLERKYKENALKIPQHLLPKKLSWITEEHEVVEISLVGDGILERNDEKLEFSYVRILVR